MEDRSTLTHRSAVLEDILCGVCYITPAPAVLMLALPSTARRPRIRFHACQSILINTLLMTVVFCLHMTSAIHSYLDGANDVQLDWLPRLLCMTVWGIASIRLAMGSQFRMPVISSLAQKQANGPLFQRFAPVTCENRVPGTSKAPLNQAILSR